MFTVHGRASKQSPYDAQHREWIPKGWPLGGVWGKAPAGLGRAQAVGRPARGSRPTDPPLLASHVRLASQAPRHSPSWATPPSSGDSPHLSSFRYSPRGVSGAPVS